jgi:hypothetical protein
VRHAVALEDLDLAAVHHHRDRHRDRLLAPLQHARDVAVDLELLRHAAKLLLRDLEGVLLEVGRGFDGRHSRLLFGRKTA